MRELMIDRIDHVVLTVRDIEATCAFYGDVLGMQVVRAEGGRVALHFGGQKINLHQAGREFEPKAATALPGSGDVCFVATRPLAEVEAHLRAAGVDVFLGPVARAGALGTMQSIYLRDPDGNLIEVAEYPAGGRYP